jgi:hypothetical protein
VIFAMLDMLAMLNMLARGDDDWMKLVGGVVFFVIWAISAIAQSVGKQKKQADEARRREQIRRQIEAPQQPPAVPQKRPVRISEGLARRFPEVARPPVPPPRKRLRPIPPPVVRDRNVAPPVIAPPAMMRGAAATEQTERLVTEAPAGSGMELLKRPAAPGAGAPAIAKWLNPRTLRQQFILTEILQPPLALRDKKL